MSVHVLPDLFADGARMVAEEAVDLTVASLIKRCTESSDQRARRADGAKPFIDEGIRNRLWPGRPQQLTAGEEADLAAGVLTLDELTRRYPPQPEVAHA